MLYPTERYQYQIKEAPTLNKFKFLLDEHKASQWNRIIPPNPICARRSGQGQVSSVICRTITLIWGPAWYSRNVPNPICARRSGQGQVSSVICRTITLIWGPTWYSRNVPNLERWELTNKFQVSKHKSWQSTHCTKSILELAVHSLHLT